MKSIVTAAGRRRPGFHHRSRRGLPAPDATPMISCLMVSRGNFFPAHLAIHCYRQQTYKNRELIIVCARKDSAVSALVKFLDDPTIRYIECSPRPLGELRNVSVKQARGSLLCTWDDDDLYHPKRLELQASDLGSKQAAGYLSRLLLWWPDRRLLGVTSQRAWENSMLARREALPKYPALQLGEDSYVLEKIESRHQIVLSDRPEMYCYVIHSHNTCGTAHFENLFGSADWIYPDYDAQMAYLSADYPLRWYADELCAQTAGMDGVSREDDGVALSLYARRSFGSQKVIIDGRRFQSCTFEQTNLIYQGGVLPKFDDCDLSNANLSFVGSALNTLMFIRSLTGAGLSIDGPGIDLRRP